MMKNVFNKKLEQIGFMWPVYSLQHILTMVGATIVAPMIVSGLLGLSLQQAISLTSFVLLGMGVATILQAYFGVKMPIIQGSSFVYIPAILYISNLSQGSEALQYLFFGIIIAALVQIFIGITGIAGFFSEKLTKIVLGPTIFMIGISLFSVASDGISNNISVGVITILLILFLTFFIKKTEWLKSSSIILSMIIMVVLISLGVFGEGVEIIWPEYLGLSLPALIPWGMPIFNLDVALLFALAAIISSVESIGDYTAVSSISKSKKLGKKEVSRGITFEGLGSLISGFLGGLPTTSYSENVGVVGITKQYSRFLVAASGVILIFLSILGVANFLVAVDQSVMAGVYFVVFGVITGIGLKQISNVNLESMRNLTIIGIAIFSGFAIPALFTEPDGSVLSAIFQSGMVVTFLVALILDLLISKED